MARTKKETGDTNAEVGSIEDAFKVLEDLNPEATFLSENSLSTVKEWISTGSYALNSIISGSPFKGVPMGRITGFSGPSGCGKTLILNKIASNAQKKGINVVYFDTENALDMDTAERLGCDVSKIKHCPIEIIEDCRNQIVKFLKAIVDNNLQGKFMIIIDSLGNLISAREAKVIEDQKDSADMGSRALSCLCPNTLIYTINGFKKLSDINVGDLVLTHLGRYRKVLNKWDTKHSEYIKIKTKDSEIILSKNHKLLVKRNSKLSYIEAQYIKLSDKLLKIIEPNL
jgi:hypothetical protein